MSKVLFIKISSTSWLCYSNTQVRNSSHEALALESEQKLVCNYLHNTILCAMHALRWSKAHFPQSMVQYSLSQYYTFQFLTLKQLTTVTIKQWSLAVASHADLKKFSWILVTIQGSKYQNGILLIIIPYSSISFCHTRWCQTRESPP